MVLHGILISVLTYISWIYFTFVHTAFSIWNSLKKREAVPKPIDEDLNQLLLISATQIADMIRAREIRAQQVIEVFIRRIEYTDTLLNAVVQDNFDDALREAKAIDIYLDSLNPDSEEFKLAKHKPLLGVPVTCKDSIRVKGLKTVCGIPEFIGVSVNRNDAKVIDMLREAGAVLLAVTNVPEAGLWWETSNKINGRTRNPYDVRLTVGGSSGGEGSLISSAGSVVGVGSDIGGSIRIPAALNGVFGLKPTPALIPFTGHVPDVLPSYHKEMATLGPICRFAKDLCPMLKIMVGPSNAGILKLDEPINLRSVKVFYMFGFSSFMFSPLHPNCLQAVQKAAKYFEKKYDNSVYKVDFPITQYATTLFMGSIRCSGSLPVKNCLAGFDPNKSVNIWIEILKSLFGQSQHSGAALMSAFIDEISRLFEIDEDFVASNRTQLKREVSELLGNDSILIFPSLPRPHYYHNEPLFCPLDFIYSGLWSALGLPVVSCPMGLTLSGLPLAVQIVGGPNSDRLLMAAACDLEEGFGGWTPREYH